MRRDRGHLRWRRQIIRKGTASGPSVALLATLATVSVLVALGAACHVDALIGSGGGGGSGAKDGLDSLAQFRSDSATPIPMGGSVAEPTIVVRAKVLRDSTLADPVRLEVEVQPVGTMFQEQATAQSDPTTSGSMAYVRVGGLADEVAYHWQARVVDNASHTTAWRSYGANSENAADLRVVLPVVATHLAFTQQPPTTTAGAVMTPSVQVTMMDGQGSPITSFTGTMFLAIDGGLGDPGWSRSANAVGGVATFSDASITTAGTYRLDATSDGVAGATSTSFAITPEAPDHLVFLTQPSNTQVNQAITPPVRVAVHDQYSNVVTSFTDLMFMEIITDGSPLHNATLDPAGAHRAASAGIATFEDLRIDQVGVGYQLQVSASGVRGVKSDAFDITLLGGTAPRQSGQN